MTLVVVFMILAGLIAASFHHTLGTAPILGALLCAACFLRKRDVLLVGLGAMLVREAAVGVSVFSLVRLAAILGVAGVIWALRVRPSGASLFLALSAAAPVYHLILATGDWLTHFCTNEPHTWAGFTATLMSSLLYMQRSVLNDFLFTAAFLGAYTLGGSLIRRRWPSVLPASSSR